MNDCSKKIEHLNSFLLEKERISIADILKLSEEDLAKKIENDSFNENELEKICSLFYLDLETLKNDGKEIPEDHLLQIDETILSASKGDYHNEIGKKKMGNVIKKNYGILDKKTKKKLWINFILSCVPFLAFLLYSFITVIANDVSTLNTYRTGDSLSESQQKIANSLAIKGDTLQYVDVNVGAQLESIDDVSVSNSSYTVTMVTCFDFDQADFHSMWWLKEKGEIFNKNGFYNAADLLQDEYCFDKDGTSFLKYSDNIPDIFQFNFEEGKHLSEAGDPISVSTLYEAERAAYPGEKSSNVYTDKNDEFRIGNGKITPDSLEYQDRGTAYYDKESKSYRFSQKLHFQAQIGKTFDSPRFPLDSAQFHIYIQPIRTTDYIRYVPSSEMSGMSTYFKIGGGYRLIKEGNGIKNFVTKLNYYQDMDLDPSSLTYQKQITKTQFEIIVRANKSGFAIFLNSFLNIIAVAVWLILAFFNQSYNREDSLGMIGTGFFSAISAILLGFSLVSNANMVSILSIVNVFTLCMVLLMGYESLASKHASKLGNASLLAYRRVKMRLLFYFFVICSILMYIVLPAISYLWIL